LAHYPENGAKENIVINVPGGRGCENKTDCAEANVNCTGVGNETTGSGFTRNFDPSKGLVGNGQNYFLSPTQQQQMMQQQMQMQAMMGNYSGYGFMNNNYPNATNGGYGYPYGYGFPPC
jgi:hypothetical protein